jgi:hypothetical protein
MDAKNVIFVLSIVLLNNFLQSDFMLDLINRNVVSRMGFDFDLGLPTDKQMERKAVMSTMHTFVLVVLVVLGAATQLNVVTKAVANVAKKVRLPA